MRTRLAAARHERDKGFTLIELLVVIIIIGILAAIAVPVFLNQRKKGVDASLKADLKNASMTAMLIVEDGHPQLDEPRWRWSLSGFGPREAIDVFEAFEYKGSPGNRLYVSGIPSGNNWTLCAYNEGASQANARSTGMVWDPARGGLQTGLSDCTTGFLLAYPRSAL